MGEKMEFPVSTSCSEVKANWTSTQNSETEKNWPNWDHNSVIQIDQQGKLRTTKRKKENVYTKILYKMNVRGWNRKKYRKNKCGCIADKQFDHFAKKFKNLMHLWANTKRRETGAHGMDGKMRDLSSLRLEFLKKSAAVFPASQVFSYHWFIGRRRCPGLFLNWSTEGFGPWPDGPYMVCWLQMASRATQNKEEAPWFPDSWPRPPVKLSLTLANSHWMCCFMAFNNALQF